MTLEPRYCTPCGEDLTPDQVFCPFCDEPTLTRADAEEAYWMGRYEGEPAMTLDEMHAAAWLQKQELRR